jgi:two-component system, NtrC family, sensor kinase
MAQVGLLVSDIAHEIYNPLAWVKLNAGMLRMQVDQALATGDAQQLLARLPKLTELLKDNEEGLERIQHVVDALRLMSRGHSDDRSQQDLNQLCQRTLVMLNQAFKHKGIEVETAWAALPPIICNGNDVAQAVMNLLVNAKDAVGPHGHVRLSTYTANGHAVVEVSDDGPGVPPEIRPRIFEPFFTTKPLGTGLGLPLVLSVAQDHAGTVEVDSNRQGGATFRLRLPLPHGQP